MNLPAEFIGRVYEAKTGFLSSRLKLLDQIQKDWPGSEIDVVYENLQPITVLVFETTEDCLAFTLKYGKEYV